MPDERERTPARDVRVRILFVCLGNICRSPTAEGVMRTLVREAELEDAIELDSAGTGAWHVGNSPDARATETARARGIALEGAAREVRDEDFEDFDLILAMDRENLANLRRLAPDKRGRARIRLLREFDPASADVEDLDVPDPYYGGPQGFEHVLDLVHAASAGLLEELRERLGRAPDVRDGDGGEGAAVETQPEDDRSRDVAGST